MNEKNISFLLEQNANKSNVESKFIVMLMPLSLGMFEFALDSM